ncbi:hypothetical protein P691DRAFT_761161 [Macrolepiota fuliginosa MF-IS2]|uniref:Uncharacterized protein n=1 Tax=Macrolepiota fuliginosa MF-IS2 TaxID=1400762 RepID=A0A9P6C352_9AGAR|nr:hypothetical protein P691DRAFT_761161 [Macrolepiota fuliginosa MF-IS2]
MPGPGPIFWDGQDVNIYERWIVVPGQPIRNVATGNTIVVSGGQIIAYPDGNTIWSIEAAGGNTFVIKLPNQNLVWTLQDNRVFLSPADGSPGQRFILTRL